MTFLQLVVLAIVQGLTEFLPVSSSAHLILASHLFQWPDQGLVLDVAVHLGTLFAVLVYFRREIKRLFMAWVRPAVEDQQLMQRRLGLSMVVGSIPILFCGWLAYEYVAEYLRDVRVIAGATLVFGVLLWVADRICPRTRDIRSMDLASGLMIGLAQVLALIPGTSRSGITITMGRALGFDEDASARFSFLLSIPVIGAAGSHGIYKVLTEQTGIEWQQFLVATVVSAIAGWVCIAAFLALLKKVGLGPFILYRLLLGVVILLLVL